MSAPLSDYWVVEYHFCGDCFSVRELPDYLAASQRAFDKAEFFESTLLAIHPTEIGAQDECSVWQDRRNQSPLTFAQRIAQLRPRLEALEELESQSRSDP